MLAKAGVNTVLQIGASAAGAIAAAKAGMSLVRLPHAAADNLGINLFYDEVERRFSPLNNHSVQLLRAYKAHVVRNCRL